MKNWNSSKNQEIKGQFVEREVVACASQLVYELNASEGFQDNIFEEFYSANKWVNDYFKQFNPNLSQTLENSSSIISTIIEFMLNNKIGQVFNVLFKKITIQKWNVKFKSLHKDDFNIALKSTDSISKHHPSNFQKKVILALNSKIEEVKTNFNIILSKENV